MDKYKRRDKAPVPRHELSELMRKFLDEIESGRVRSFEDTPRLGIKPVTLRKYLWNAGRSDLVRKLKGGT